MLKRRSITINHVQMLCHFPMDRSFQYVRRSLRDECKEAFECCFSPVNLDIKKRGNTRFFNELPLLMTNICNGLWTMECKIKKENKNRIYNSFIIILIICCPRRSFQKYLLKAISNICISSKENMKEMG